MSLPMRFAATFVALVLSTPLSQPYSRAGEPPLVPFGHSHNDYQHQRPLLDALDAGFASVEADVFLVDGELLVGHAPWELRPGRTLKRLYLQPLAERAKANQGRIHAEAERFWLFIDMKTDGPACYAVLKRQLAEYAEMLTKIDGDQATPGAVTVVVSGNRPVKEIAADKTRYAAVDGRLSDLKGTAPVALLPVISDQWTSHFSWNGEGDMPASERTKLVDIVAQAHDAGRIVRFWATPESESFWTELRAAGVDLINTDQLKRLAEFSCRSQSNVK